MVSLVYLSEPVQHLRHQSPVTDHLRHVPLGLHSVEIIIDLLPGSFNDPQSIIMEALPVELLERITEFLDLRDITSLRLTSLNIDSKTSQGHFVKFFAHKNIRLDPRTLQNMVRVTGQGRLGCLLRHCTISGIAGTEMIAASEVDEHIGLLIQAFRNLKQLSPTGRLASMCLRVVVRVQHSEDDTSKPEAFRSWKDIWDAALRTFNVTTAALNESQLPVDEHLDIFGGITGCSLAYDAFTPLTQRFSPTHVFRSLKKLTLSLSSPYRDLKGQPSDVTPTMTGDLGQSAHATLALQCVLQMSEIMPELESLHLHWYSPGDDRSTAPVQSTTRLNSSSPSTFARLKDCSLRGVHVSGDNLLQFVKAVQPVALTMTDIRLVFGTYTSLFEYLALPGTPVTYCHFDDIREGKDLVHLDVPGSLKFRYRGVDTGPSTLTRQESHVKETIRYQTTPRRPLGSGERMRWVKSKARESGPPGNEDYDFVALNS